MKPNIFFFFTGATSDSRYPTSDLRLPTSDSRILDSCVIGMLNKDEIRQNFELFEK